MPICSYKCLLMSRLNYLLHHRTLFSPILLSCPWEVWRTENAYTSPVVIWVSNGSMIYKCSEWVCCLPNKFPLQRIQLQLLKSVQKVRWHRWKREKGKKDIPSNRTSHSAISCSKGKKHKSTLLNLMFRNSFKSSPLKARRSLWRL